MLVPGYFSHCQADAGDPTTTLTLGGHDLLGQALDDGVNLPQLIDELKRHYLKRALERTAGNKTQAAKLLGLENHQALTNWTVAVGLADCVLRRGVFTPTGPCAQPLWRVHRRSGAFEAPPGGP